MVYDDETTARNAEHSTVNDPGYCLAWSRQRAGIDAYYGDAATAWRNTNDRHPGNRNPPRGSMVFWTGGSHGYGHIAVSVGGGKVRSTDAGGSGRVATVGIDWPTQHWGLPYAGWAWDVNEVTIPHGPPPDDDPLAAWDTNEELSAAVLGGHRWKWKGEAPDPQSLQEHVTVLRRQMETTLDVLRRLE